MNSAQLRIIQLTSLVAVSVSIVGGSLVACSGDGSSPEPASSSASSAPESGGAEEPALPDSAPGSDSDFAFTLPTSASRASIWALWTDVPGWPRWDSSITAAQIDGPFRLGARGASTSEGRDSAFQVTGYDELQSYEVTFPLPAGALVIRRSFESDANRTLFTHRVQFTGEGGTAIGSMLGPGFRASLPRVMDALRRLAEER